MALAIDHDSKVIFITSPTTEMSAQVLHDYIEDYMASPPGLLDDDLIKPEGKIEDASNPGVFSQIILILHSEWQIQFWPGSGYTRIYGGKLVGGLNDQPMKATGAAGDITVLESPVDGVTVATSGSVTPADVADEVWNHLIHTGYTAEATMKIMVAAMAGKLSGADGTTITIRDLLDTTDIITATVDADGNRLGVALNVP